MIYSSSRSTGVEPSLCGTPLRLTYCLWAHSGSSDPRPSTDVEEPRLVRRRGATFLTLPRRHQGGSRCLVFKSRREPPSLLSLGAWGTPSPSATDPVVIDSKDARTADEEVEVSPVAKRTPWPIGLHSVEERRKKEEEERKGGEEEEEKERRWQQGERLEEQLEQCRQQELLEL